MRFAWRDAVVVFACTGLLGSGCLVPDLGGIGDDLFCGLRGTFDGLNDALAAIAGQRGQEIESEAGGYTATAYCGDADCADGAVLRGSSLQLQLDMTQNALDAGLEPPSIPEGIAFVSGPKIRLDAVQAVRDGCDDHVHAAANLTFQENGAAAVHIRDRGMERARFDFRVDDAAEIELQAYVGESEPAVCGTPVRAPAGALVRVRSLVRNAEGERLATGGAVHFWVDDPKVASLTLLAGGLGTSGDGDVQMVLLGQSGRTTVHALVANLTATLDIEITELPPPPAGDSCAGDEDAGVADDAGVEAQEVEP